MGNFVDENLNVTSKNISLFSAVGGIRKGREEMFQVREKHFRAREKEGRGKRLSLARGLAPKSPSLPF